LPQIILISQTSSGIFFSWVDSPSGPRPHSQGFTITLRCGLHAICQRDEATSSSQTLVPISNYTFSHPIEEIFRCVHNIAKNDHQQCHVCLSICLSIHLPVCLSSCMEQLSSHAGFLWKFMR